jgi:hypothetical protein
VDATRGVEKADGSGRGSVVKYTGSLVDVERSTSIVLIVDTRRRRAPRGGGANRRGAAEVFRMDPADC